MVVASEQNLALEDIVHRIHLNVFEGILEGSEWVWEVGSSRRGAIADDADSTMGMSLCLEVFDGVV